MQQMSGLVTDYMESHGTEFVWKCVPERVERLTSGVLRVTWTDSQTGREHKDTYDSVLWAVGESVRGNGMGCVTAGAVYVCYVCVNMDLSIYNTEAYMCMNMQLFM